MNEKDNLKVFYAQKDSTEIDAFSRYLLGLVLNVLDIPTTHTATLRLLNVTGPNTDDEISWNYLNTLG